MNFWEKLLAYLFAILMLPFAAALYLLMLNSQSAGGNLTASVESAVIKSQAAPAVVEEAPPKKLANPPSIINAVYVTGWSAGSSKYFKYLSNLFLTTEINAVVVDIKDYTGLVSYNSQAPEVKKYGLTDGAIKDINALVKFFHDQNIYAIGRISVFEDPAYSKVRPDLAVQDKGGGLWLDNHKLSWMDPAAKEVWDYNISLAKDAFLHGFDEINFDYVRFPSDGKTENMELSFWDGKTPRHVVISNFFKYVRENLPDEKLSADLFGLATVNNDDLGIGQKLEDTFNNFDYVSPMVYPSHYAKNFIGFFNPADHPYEVIKYSMDKAMQKQAAFQKAQAQLALEQGKMINVSPDLTANSSAPLAQSQAADLFVDDSEVKTKFRPWIQDFNMGAIYTSDMVKKEIQAVKDALGENYAGIMLWNPSNIYTQEAVLKPKPMQ
mgnify:CR=1 FL=1